MAGSWRTVRVFISSTFKDMQAERDHVVRFAFPRLREELLKRRVHLVDVDLRWGVTTDQDALEVCREVIDECRPRFICILGGRYGWTPPGREQSITADEVAHALDDPLQAYRFFYSRDPKATASIPEEKATEYREPTGSEAEGKLAALKGHVRDAGFEPFVYPARWDQEQGRLTDLEAFGERVRADLVGSVDDELGVEPPEALDEFAEEAAAMEAFVEERVERYVVGSRQGLLDQLGDFAQADGRPSILALTGSPGSGKSALLAVFCRRHQAAHADALIIPHFVGVSAGSTDLRRTLRRLCHELGDADPRQETRELTTRFAELLGQAGSARRVVLVLDAVNQLDPSDNAHSMYWLPRPLPEGVRLIASSLEHPALEAIRARGDEVRDATLGALTADDGRAIIDEFLRRYRKRMDDKQIAALLAKPECGSPLYLLVALEELRTLGIYERITKDIVDLPDDVRSLFLWVLRDRLSQDPGFRDADGHPIGADLVRRFVSLLGVSRHGLSQTELAELIAPGDPPDALGSVAALERLLRPYLMHRGELLDFYHTQFREAVEAVYLDEEQERLDAHRTLAAYFRAKADPAGDGTWKGTARGLSELPYHQTEGRMWEGLEGTLTDLLFIEAKCEAGMTYALVGDHNAALAAEDLPAERCEAIEPFARFVRGNAHILAQHLEWVLQRAYNTAASGPVAEQAERLLNDPQRPKRPWLRRLHRPVVASGACELTLAGHEDWVNSVALTEDGSRAVSGSSDGTLRAWDLSTGQCLRTLEGGPGPVHSVAVTGDGNRAVSSDNDGTVRVWRLATGQCLCALQGHAGPVHSVRLTADGARAVSAGWDHTLKVWDLSAGQCLRTLRMHTGPVSSVALTRDGARAVSGSTDGTLRAWDLATGQCLRTIPLNVPDVLSVAVTGDGARAASASMSDRALRVWDLATGQCLCALRGHADWVNSVALTEDGSRAVSGGQDHTLKVWDLSTGQCLRTLEVHTGPVSSVALTRDGARAVSGSGDRTLRVWDVAGDQYPWALAAHAGRVRSVAVSADGALAVSGSLDGSVKVWDLTTGQCLRTADVDARHALGVAATRDGGRAVSARLGVGLEVLELATARCLRVLSGHVASVASVTLTADGARAVSAGRDHTLKVWDLATGRCLRVLEGDPGSLVALTRDGARAVSCSGSSFHRTLRVWDLASGRCLRALECVDRPTSIAVTGGGLRVVYGTEGGSLEVWDLAAGERVQTLEGHTGPVWSVALTSDHVRAVSGSGDRTLRVWDLPSGGEVACFFAEGSIQACAVSANGVIVAGDDGGNVHFVELEDLGWRPAAVTAWPRRIATWWQFWRQR